MRRVLREDDLNPIALGLELTFNTQKILPKQRNIPPLVSDPTILGSGSVDGG